MPFWRIYFAGNNKMHFGLSPIFKQIWSFWLDFYNFPHYQILRKFV